MKSTQYVRMCWHTVLASILLFVAPAVVSAAQYKVLVVMSYEENYPWCQEMKTAIDATLKETSDVRYFYMDTKTHPENGEQKAKEAYALYQEFQPDGVLTADDNAQSMFVVPYLKDTVKTPVIFCGVNADPAKYGYPASNVSGVLERYHILEAIAFAKQLSPGIEKVGLIARDDSTGAALLAQIEQEAANYPAQFVGAKMTKTLAEAVTEAKAFAQTCDALLIGPTEGLPDEQGAATGEKSNLPPILSAFGKPTISFADWRVKYGVLLGVLVMGEEQGGLAAEMLLKAMQGTPLADLPINQGRHGRKTLNVNVLRDLNIKPPSAIVRGAELVKTEE